MNLTELLIIKYPQITFLNDVIIQNEEIISWNLGNLYKPSSEDLMLWKTTYDLIFRQRQVMDIRKSQYPSWEKQLQMQYADLINNTTTWKDTIKAVKIANPIPME